MKSRNQIPKMNLLAIFLLALPAVLSISKCNDASAGEYCFYHYKNGFQGLGLSGGDIICVDCPANRKCKGPEGTGDFFAEIEDSSGKTAGGRLTKTSSGRDCTSCPRNGKKGYRFVN